jgi:hypothetical protein
MVTKVLQIASWVPMCSLPWTQCERWIPIGSMGCVHTHRGMPTIEGLGSPSRVRNVMQKIGEDNREAWKIGQVISQTFAPRLKHDKIWARWASDVPSGIMLERVWGANTPRWNLEIELFVARWVVQMEEDTHRLGVVKHHMSPWCVVGKEMCCCQHVLMFQEGRDVDQP